MNDKITRPFIILENKIQCIHCNDIIESKTVHDFVQCSCGKVSVDGGKEYLKRSFEKEGDFVELSEVSMVKR